MKYRETKACTSKNENYRAECFVGIRRYLKMSSAGKRPVNMVSVRFSHSSQIVLIIKEQAFTEWVTKYSEIVYRLLWGDVHAFLSAL